MEVTDLTSSCSRKEEREGLGHGEKYWALCELVDILRYRVFATPVKCVLLQKKKRVIAVHARKKIQFWNLKNTPDKTTAPVFQSISTFVFASNMKFLAISRFFWGPDRKLQFNRKRNIKWKKDGRYFASDIL